MADEQHLYLLNRGVEIWNQWRQEHPDIQPNLHAADLSGVQLNKADLHRADFSESDLSKTNLIGTNLFKADLRGAHLFKTDFRKANLSEANLSKSNLSKADFGEAYLKRAKLTEANLNGTIFIETNLRMANLTGAIVHLTIFGGVDLGQVQGLDKVKHQGPSTIGIDTIYRSQGKIPEIFLRSAGVPDSIIEALPSLIGSFRPIDFYSCFISYSDKDRSFAERLYADLQAEGIRCWFAPEDLIIGDHFADRIEESIRAYDKLLIVLSENSVRSSWVEDEFRAALEKENRFRQEQQINKTVLFPIKLDETVKEATAQWVSKMRRERHIGDFTNWKEHDAYQQAFQRLLRDLKQES